MALQTGILGLRGKVGGMIFRRNGVVSQAPPSNRDWFLNSPNAARVRENAAEFTAAAQAGKLLRDALRVVAAPVRDRFMVSRLTQQLGLVQRLDQVSPRGLRTFQQEHLGLLKGFDFNARAPLSASFAAVAQVVVSAPENVGDDNQAIWMLDVRLVIPVLRPLQDLAVPPGATHYELVVVPLVLDFGNALVVALPLSNVFGTPGVQPLAADAVSVEVRTQQWEQLHPLTEAYAVALGVRYYQQVNGQLYPVALMSSPLAIYDVVLAPSG